VALVAAALLALVGLAGSRLRATDPISPATYDRLRPGIEAEVVALFGLPPGDYSGPMGEHITDGPFALPVREWGEPFEGAGSVEPDRGAPHLRQGWWGDRYAVDVYFDLDGRAVGACLCDVVALDTKFPRWVGRLRELFGRLGL
jgi:hypothetical protein